jgi:Mrp family chromosome partitioning ATPase
VPAGVTTLNPILLFNSGRMSAFIDEVRKDFDLVLIRSSAMRGHRDPSILAQFTDTVLVVVEEGKVRRQVIAQALAEVQSRARSVTGVLLINRSFPVPKWIYELI